MPAARAADARSEGLTDLKQRVEELTADFGDSADLVIRYYHAPCEDGDGPAAATVVMEGLVDPLAAGNAVISAVSRAVDEHGRQQGGAPFRMKDHLISAVRVQRMSDYPAAACLLTRGYTLVLSSGDGDILACGTARYVGRQVEQPSVEAGIRGPKDTFVESLVRNMALLRFHLSDTNLRIEQHMVGKRDRTRVALCYIDGLANEHVVNELRERVSMLDVDAVHELGQLEEVISDAPYSLFPTMLRTERVDRTAGGLLEGRVAVMIDATPFAAIMPATFSMFLTAPDDYYQHFLVATVTRFMRAVALTLSVSLPAVYVAITTFHQELLPTPLILSIASQREGVPFPALVEALLLEIVFDVVREAALRVPAAIGPTIGIVGVLLLGEAAIGAGLVSPIMVIVVAATAVSSFSAPAPYLFTSMRIVALTMTLLGATLGFFGVSLGLFALLAHLASMESFGVPYLSPFMPVVSHDLQDSVIRVPWWRMKGRPRALRAGDSQRVRRGERN